MFYHLLHFTTPHSLCHKWLILLSSPKTSSPPNKQVPKPSLSCKKTACWFIKILIKRGSKIMQDFFFEKEVQVILCMLKVLSGKLRKWCKFATTWIQFFGKWDFFIEKWDFYWEMRFLFENKIFIEENEILLRNEIFFQIMSTKMRKINVLFFAS